MERVNTTEIFEDHRPEFERLAHTQEFVNFADNSKISQLDELPIYSRDSEVAFLDKYDTPTRNRVLIYATFTLLKEALTHQRHAAWPDGYLHMVSIPGWWEREPFGAGLMENDGSQWLLQPRLWIGNFNSTVVADNFRMHQGLSIAADFTRSALPIESKEHVFESYSRQYGDESERIERVYITLPGSPESIIVMDS
ncbi:hypothetical protein ACFC06_06935 [Nocardia sp. NPDC056064]|uniref:hypothetical protein n=1 Tax=Nocardia sp. NPDC056064 TaxID=3345701 RepID=UPI0035D5859B